jgi:hypothetical protein
MNTGNNKENMASNDHKVNKNDNSKNFAGEIERRK